MGYDDRRDFEILKDQVILSIEGCEAGSSEVIFTLTDGRKYRMYHDQDCCENVSLEDVCGDVFDMVGSPIRLAEKVSNADKPPEIQKSYEENPEWTFYKLVTQAGAVTLRWYGDSNGYYSTGVDFEEMHSSPS